MARSTIAIALLVVVAVSSVAACPWAGQGKQKSTADDVSQLQIGIKKRAENCERKAANGDKVTIYFTVGAG